MPIIQTKPSYKPKCPNHGCPLDGIGFPMPAKGVGICPVSGCPFEYEAEVDEEKMGVDKFGNKVKMVGWKLTGND
jgi:hypothetical protein